MEILDPVSSMTLFLKELSWCYVWWLYLLTFLPRYRKFLYAHRCLIFVIRVIGTRGKWHYIVVLIFISQVICVSDYCCLGLSESEWFLLKKKVLRLLIYILLHYWKFLFEFLLFKIYFIYDFMLFVIIAHIRICVHIPCTSREQKKESNPLCRCAWCLGLNFKPHDCSASILNTEMHGRLNIFLEIESN